MGTIGYRPSALAVVVSTPRLLDLPSRRLAAIAELDLMAADVPLDTPWTAPEAASWDAQTVATWLDDNIHYAMHTADGRVTYGYGRDLTYEVLGTWVSPRTGHQYGLYALLQTPIGTFYVSPKVADQEIVILGLAAPLWEGALEVRRDASDGPIVGRMYMEEQFGVSDPALPPHHPRSPSSLCK